MTFDRIIGQKEVIGALKLSVQTGRIGHACVFTGPKGIGKRTVAAEYAGLLLCENNAAESACGHCKACMLYEGSSNPDFRKITAGGAAIGVDEIREMQRDIAVRPVYSKRKVYIIEDADKMTVQAQNCLLKTLEEPPEYGVILLTASNYDALLETIRSRSQRFSFRKNTYEEVCSAVDMAFAGKDACKTFAVSFADGVIGTALELAGGSDIQSMRDRVLALIAKLGKAKLYDVFGEYSFFEDYKDDIDSILTMMSMYYRDIMVAKETGNENMLINSDKKDIIFSNASGYSVFKLLRNIGLVEAARREIKQNANYQLSIEHLLIKLQEESNNGEGGRSQI
jgi:DNA polymerase-3 subunit delta'